MTEYSKAYKHRDVILKKKKEYMSNPLEIHEKMGQLHIANMIRNRGKMKDIIVSYMTETGDK